MRAAAKTNKRKASNQKQNSSQLWDFLFLFQPFSFGFRCRRYSPSSLPQSHRHRCFAPIAAPTALQRPRHQHHHYHIPPPPLPAMYCIQPPPPKPPQRACPPPLPPPPLSPSPCPFPITTRGPSKREREKSAARRVVRRPPWCWLREVDGVGEVAVRICVWCARRRKREWERGCMANVGESGRTRTNPMSTLHTHVNPSPPLPS